MGMVEALAKRRSYYDIGKTLPVDEAEVVKLVESVTELVPDAFNMKSARVVLAFSEQHDRLWDEIYKVFHGKVPREKIDSFKAGAGTVLYFYDQAVIEEMQGQYESYAANFPIWAMQANGMLQLAVWTGLCEMGIGASVQHYNPLIDSVVREMFDVPRSYVLMAQMPFGGIVSEPAAKPAEDIHQRVKTVR